MATIEQLQAQLAQMQEQQNRLLEGMRRANAGYESQAARINELETRNQQTTDELNRTRTELTTRTEALANMQQTQAQQTQAQAQTQVQTQSQSSTDLTRLIHPSNVPKPHVYDGKREGWEKFKHVFMAWSSTVHPKFPELLEKFGSDKDPIDEQMMTPEEDLLAKAMYTFLIQYCPEPTMNVVGQGLHTANGFEVWRRLVKLTEPAYRTKAWVWRRHLSNPNFPKDINSWSSALHQWESELREFERTTKSTFSEEEKISILAHIAPAELQQSIFMHSDALGTYAKIRDYIEQYLINKNVWKRPQGSQFGLTKAANKVDDGGPMPMDIGAVKGKGKGKSKDKGNSKGYVSQDKGGKKGGKSKGKDEKGKGKGFNEKGKGKGKGDGGKQGSKGSQVTNPDAGKQCHNCHKYGHVAKDCWWKVASVDETTPAAGNTANNASNNDKNKPNPGGTNAVSSVSSQPLNHDQVVFTVRDAQVSAVSSDDDEFTYLLVDSGACENVARHGEFQDPINTSMGKPLFGVQGNPLMVYGKQFPRVEVGKLKGCMSMTVTDSAESLLSVYNLVDKGHKVHFEQGNCYMVTSANEKVPLELHGKRWYLKVKQNKQENENTSSTKRVAALKGKKVEEEREPDTWKMESNEDGDFVIRVHNTPRFQLFNPERVNDLPVEIEKLKPGRLTKMYYTEDGTHETNESSWKNRRTAAKNMSKEWLGESWFKLEEEAIAKPEAEKVEGLVNPEQDMDDFFADWILGDPEDAMDDDERQAEEIREQRQLQEKEDDEQVKEPDIPAAPSQEEREKHMLHHANFEPWCEVCVKGQGRDAPHRKQKEDKKQHIIYSDYMFFSTSGNEVSKEDGKKQKGLITVLTAICKDSQYPFAMVVPAKGGGYYARDALANWIRDLGWEKVIIQTDRENAMNKLFERVRDLMPERVDIRKSPRYSSQSLADGEMVNGLIAGKIRTWLCELSENYQEKIGTDHYMFPWVVRHSAWTLARFHINKTKTTAFQVIKGREYISELMPLGETVMGKYPKVKDKAAPRWVKGVYAGKTESSDEHLVLTGSGALTFRTVRRLPRGSQFQNAIMDAARGAPWNTVLGSDRAKPDPVRSELNLTAVPELEAQETYEFQEGEGIEQGSLPALIGEGERSVVPAPATPMLAPAPRTPKATSASAPGTPRVGTGTRSAPGTPKHQSPAKVMKKDPAEKEVKKMSVDAEGESIDIEEKEAKKQRTSEESTSANPAGDTVVQRRQPQVFRIDTPEDNKMSDAAQDVVSSIGEGRVLEPDELKEKHKIFSSEDYQYFKKWLEKRKDNFEIDTVANIMDYLDTLGPEGEERKLARKAELKKLNESFEAFRPRDRRALPKEIVVFGHKWVDKVSEGVAKSRLTCQDFKRKGQKEDKNSSETPSNFCPTPFAASRKVLEVYSMSTGMPRCKADLTSAFLIATDQGDRAGQPVMMKPPEEWLEEYDEWLLMQSKELQEELREVPKSEIVWQVNGNLYGRQSAAAQYRDRLDTILTEELPKEKYEFTRGQIDACVYKCKKTGTVLLHHIDDFDICGPESVIQDLLMIQLPRCGCKLKMGELEYPNVGSKTTSEFLGRTKISVEEAAITKPNAKHINTILTQLGLEDCKPGPVPGKKLQLEHDKPLDEKQKATFASCVGSAIYLSQDRPDIKYSVKELAKRIREPRECDWINLKILGRYLKGTVDYGHVTKIAEGLYIQEGLPLHSYCDSDWAGDLETRRSTTGEAIFLGGTLVESSSHTQPGEPATSSGEAEIRALSHCGRTTIFIRNLAEHDFGMKVETPRIWCDSSAALQAARKMGVGKMRHIEVGHLYIQSLVKSKQVIIGKIEGTQNPADILTKYLATGEQMRTGTERIGLVDLNETGLEKHVSKVNMKTIGAIAENLKPWKPHAGSKLTIRQFATGLKRNGSIKGNTLDWTRNAG